MNKFKKWDKRVMRDEGREMSAETKAFYRAFKNYLKRAFPDAEVTGFTPKNFSCNGFITKGERSVFIYHSFYHLGYGVRVNFSDDSFLTGVLYREAKGATDPYGGPNHYTSIYGLSRCVREMLSEPVKAAA